MRMDWRRRRQSTRPMVMMVMMMANLDGDQSGSTEEVFPAVGHVCPLALSLGLLPPGRKNTET